MRDIAGRNRALAEALRGLSIEVLELDVADQARWPARWLNR